MTNKKAVGFSCRFFFVTGGGKRDRTADLMIANHSLSQLSYTPSDNADYKESKLARSFALMSQKLTGVLSPAFRLASNPLPVGSHPIYPQHLRQNPPFGGLRLNWRIEWDCPRRRYACSFLRAHEPKAHRRSIARLSLGVEPTPRGFSSHLSSTLMTKPTFRWASS